MVNFWWFENWILSPFTRRVRVVKGRAIKIVLHVTHMSRSIAVNARKKNWLTKSPNKIHMEVPPSSSSSNRSMSLHLQCDWVTDWLCSPVDMSNKNPTAMCRPTLNFFLPSIGIFFPFIFHFLFIWRFLVSSVCFFTCLTKTRLSLFFVYDWWGVLMSSLSFFTHKRWA